MYRVHVRVVAFSLIAALPLAPASAQTPPARVQYPATRTVDHVDTYAETKITDPYRWLEAIDSNSVAEWVRAQNAVTLPYLASLPGRDLLKQRITALYDFPRTSVPFWEGSRWFYTKNSGLQRQSVWYARSTLDGAEQVVLDPNQLSPDGSIALSGFSPSPDGKSLAYGQSEGGSDWVTYYVRDLRTGKNTADTVRWAKFSGASWTRDGKGFFYSRFPEPTKAQQLKAKLTSNAAGIDQPIAALINDLKQRGMLKDTLLVWGGEFGRTPHAQNEDGRDHNATGFSMWMAGGGVKGGMRYGATDEHGIKAEENKMHVHDLHATILHLLGLDHTRLTYNYSGRDFRLTEVHGNVAKEILA